MSPEQRLVNVLTLNVLWLIHCGFLKVVAVVIEQHGDVDYQYRHYKGEGYE